MDRTRSEAAAQEQPIGDIVVTIAQTAAALKIETISDGKKDVAIYPIEAQPSDASDGSGKRRAYLSGSTLVDDAITVFCHLHRLPLRKRPGTAELLDFVRSLLARGFGPFDRLEGKEIWRSLRTDSEPGVASPVIFEAGGVRQLIIVHMRCEQREIRWLAARR